MPHQPRLDRLDGEPRIFETPEHALPLPLRPRRVGIDERELRARRERLPQAHARRDPHRFGRRGHRPDELLASLELRAVSTKVNNVKNHGPELVEEAEQQPEQAGLDLDMSAR